MFFFFRLEDSAVNLAESIQQGGLQAPGSLAPSIIEVLVIVTIKILLSIVYAILLYWPSFTEWKSFHCQGNAST